MVDPHLHVQHPHSIEFRDVRGNFDSRQTRKRSGSRTIYMRERGRLDAGAKERRNKGEEDGSIRKMRE